MTTKNEVSEIFKEVLTEKQKGRATLVHAFHKIQKENNYLPEEALKSLSERLNISLSEVYSTASFYKQFHFTPRGKNIVSVCIGTPCHVRGSQGVVNQLEKSFGVKVGETTEDLSLTLDTVGCVGCCGIAPIAVINDKIMGELTEERVDGIIDGINKSVYEKTR